MIAGKLVLLGDIGDKTLCILIYLNFDRMADDNVQTVGNPHACHIPMHNQQVQAGVENLCVDHGDFDIFILEREIETARRN